MVRRVPSLREKGKGPQGRQQLSTIIPIDICRILIRYLIGETVDKPH